jgi:quercetin dioxygenase-like cupin family protein
MNETLAITGSHDGPSVSIAGGSYRIVISGDQTNGAFAVIEMLVPPGGGPGPHAHPDFQESFYVLEGEIELKTKEKTVTAGKDAFVSIPPGGMVHSFKNKTENTARLLCTVVPAGLDAFFLEAGQPVQPGTFLPPPAPDKEGMKKLEKLALKYGQQLFPPDYLD